MNSTSAPPSPHSSSCIALHLLKTFVRLGTVINFPICTSHSSMPNFARITSRTYAPVIVGLISTVTSVGKSS
ncbi:unnamed protein product [Periconia digitata]|uniref:Uncharacterized protein n=1 Tax=Periconia digitata TaxID=1303443 RepID=A0A9W4XGY2_9PLEO|nr:unnamed protein product [Periconia digitata]